MRALLDTHAFLWWLSDDERLSEAARATIRDPVNVVLVSAASAWEIAIKSALGRLDLPEPPDSYVPDRIARSGFVELPITAAHALRVAALPLHHRDPFDRLLVAQSNAEGVPLVSTRPVAEPLHRGPAVVGP